MFKDNLLILCDEMITEFQTEIENTANDIMAGNGHYDTTNDNLTIEKLADMLNAIENMKIKIKAL